MMPNSTTQTLKDANPSVDFSTPEMLDATLDELAREATRQLGAAPNSKIEKAMLKLTRDVWSVAETVLKS